MLPVEDRAARWHTKIYDPEATNAAIGFARGVPLHHDWTVLLRFLDICSPEMRAFYQKVFWQALKERLEP